MRELCQRFQEVSGSFKLTVLRHSPLDVDAHSSRDARCTLRCRGAKPGQLVTHLAREIIQFKVLTKLRKGHHKLLSPSIDDSSDTMSDISDFCWWTSILTRECVTCLNLKYPLMLLQVAKSMFLEMRREPLAMAISHPREMSLSCVVPTVQRRFSTRTWTGWKRLSRAPASLDQCRKQFRIGHFFFPDGLRINRVESHIRSGRRNHAQISMYEQRGQIEQAKHRLCTLLHLMAHE